MRDVHAFAGGVEEVAENFSGAVRMGWRRRRSGGGGGRRGGLGLDVRHRVTGGFGVCNARVFWTPDVVKGGQRPSR
jgi:hypothetical protein